MASRGRNTNRTDKSNIGIVTRLSNWWKRKNYFHANRQDKAEDFKDTKIYGTPGLDFCFSDCDDKVGTARNPNFPELNVTSESGSSSFHRCSSCSKEIATARYHSLSTNFDAQHYIVKTDRPLSVTSQQTNRDQKGFAKVNHWPRPRQRSRSADSYQGSLESMDSLADSYWDPENESSSVVSMIDEPATCLIEHMDFLRVKTNSRRSLAVRDPRSLDEGRRADIGHSTISFAKKYQSVVEIEDESE